MPFAIVRQDITKMKVDAIVNSTNIDLQMGGGVCGAIFKAAGADQLQAACDRLAPIKTGEAVITPGFNLPAKYVIHAAGPVYDQGSKEQSEQLLRDSYTNSLKTAIENKCKSIAFPLISSGIYGYPKDEALKVATSVIKEILAHHDLDVTLVVYDKSSYTISRELLFAVESYIDEHYVELHEVKRIQNYRNEAPQKDDEYLSQQNKPRFKDIFVSSVSTPVIDDLVDNLDEPFSQMLLRLIDAKAMTDVEVYKRANLDRKLFSKIRSSKGYIPSKRTAVALAIALKLSLSETDSFLERAGYALSHAVRFDVIIEYFITNGKYDVFEINEVLFEYDQPLLGGCV